MFFNGGQRRIRTRTQEQEQEHEEEAKKEEEEQDQQQHKSKKIELSLRAAFKRLTLTQETWLVSICSDGEWSGAFSHGRLPPKLKIRATRDWTATVAWYQLVYQHRKQTPNGSKDVAASTWRYATADET